MFLELLQNVAILLALCMIYTLLFSARDQSTPTGRFVLGLLFGAAAILAMLTPTALFPGVLIDGRSIFISMAGLLGGGLSALVAALIALVCRIFLGGTGTPVGYAIIITAALLGTGYHHMRRNTKKPITKKQLYLFGLIVHLDMMLMMLALPADIRWHVINKVTLPVLLIYPIGTMLIGRLLILQNERVAAGRALQESEEQLAAILRAAPAGIGVIKDRIFVKVNPRVCKMTGYSPDELIGQSTQMLYSSQAEFDRTGEVKYDQIRESETGTAETRWCRKDGSSIDVLLSSTPMNATDPFVGMTFTALDITESRRVQNALRESEERYRILIENQTGLVVQIAPDGKFLFVSTSYCRMFDKTEEELLGTHFMPLIHEDDQAATEKAMKALFKPPHKAHMEQRAKTKNGWRWLAWQDSAVLDGEGNVSAIIGVGRDITQRKEAEEESARLMMAIEQAEEIIVITDAAANIQYVNPTFENVTGYSREEVLGRNPRILQSGQQPPVFYQKIWKKLANGKTWSGQLVNRKKDGTVYTEEGTISPIIDGNGNIINYVAAKHDATHELELEEQLRQAQKMEAVGQMAGGIAHDFNNLLQVISGYAELFEMDLQPDDKQMQGIREIGKATLRGKSLVNQLLAFSRRQVIEPQDMDLNTVIDPLLKMMRGMIGEHIELDFIAGRELGIIHIDCGMIEQVLMNLCVNARDAMPEHGKLTIETENVLINGDYTRIHTWATPGRYVLLNVTDTGCGMDSQTQERAFEPFFTTRDVGKGSGLGLSTVFGIIKQHDGHINVYSELGKGTIFKIYLPTVERKATEVSRKVPGPVVGGNETILIAEDDESVLALAKHLLTGAGYTVLTAMDGKEAIEIFEQHANKIDMVMFDVVMPRLGGKQALERILELRPGIPHLFASGYSENAVHTNFIQNRGLHLLSKPYQTETLLRKIREVLDEEQNPPRGEE